MMDAALAKKLKLQGISKHARPAFFQGKRKDVKGAHFSEHSCYLCGGTFPCEMDECNHAVYVRIGPCCDPRHAQERKIEFGQGEK